MPKKKPIEEEIIHEELEPDEIENALSSLPVDESQISLYRMHEQGRSRYLRKFTPLDFNLDLIRDAYGGGRYKYRAVKSGEVVKEGTFEIEGEPVVLDPVRHGRKHYIDGKWVVRNTDDDEILPETSSNENVSTALILQELRHMRESMSPPKNDSDILMQLIKSKEGEEDRFFQRMQSMKGLFTPPISESKVSADTIFSAFKEGIEIAATHGGGAEGGGGGIPSWLLILVDKFQPLIAKLVENINAPKIIPANPLEQPISSNSTADLDFLPKLLSPYLPMLIQTASQNGDPSAWVDAMSGSIPKDMIPRVLSWLESETWFTDLLKVDSRIELQAAWWEEFRKMLLEALKTPESENAAQGNGEIKPVEEK